MKRILKLIKKIFFILVLFSVTIVTPIIISILYHANVDKPTKSDVIIVLGCQVRGNTPSWTLEYRLEKALELYHQKLAKAIIVSGGQGADEPFSEASVMKSWLVSRQVDESVVFEENKSTSTYENLKYSKAIMDHMNFKSAIIVSNGFHIFRSLHLSTRVGIEATGSPAPTVGYLIPYYYSREVLASIKSILLY